MPRIIEPFAQFLDGNGDPLAGGSLQFNVSGTNNTAKATYSDINETTPNTNPVLLDGEGRCPNVFGTGSYNVASFDSLGAQIQQFDPVVGTQQEGQFSIWNSLTIYSSGFIVIADDGNYYRSIIVANENQNPTTTPSAWEMIQFINFYNDFVSYSVNDLVLYLGVFYTSLTNTNLGNTPLGDGVNWKSGELTQQTISSFTVAVASNAMTINVPATSLTFRNVDLTDGQPSVINATALSLIIPSGATIGTSNAVESDLLVIAINNAGTVELAVINMAGRIDFREKDLITTVAIDATADDGNTFYSGNVITSKSYRVIGLITSTQPTAGAWSVVPSLVQGNGGNAINISPVRRAETITGQGALATKNTTATGDIDNSAITNAKLATNAVTQAKVSTGTGGQSGIFASTFTLNMPAYCFESDVRSVNTTGNTYLITSTGAANRDAPQKLYENEFNDGSSYDAAWRYIA